ncbi:MAG: glycosyltransferase 87 family protein [Propionibacteriales bacterium]|nr:glycosyltransferase 87 family protein [Propionibacteriales bacterium]
MAAEVTQRQQEWFRAIGLTSIAVVVAALLLFALTRPVGPGMLGDLEIYKGAISYGLSGQPLYDWVYQHPTVHGLGFTYPPFAALVLAWLVPLDLLAAKIIWTLLTFVVTLACLHLLVRTALSSTSALSIMRQVAWTAGLAAPVMFTYPFLHNLVVGQVSLFVIALALFDHQLPRRWQGTLIGLAAAIKLTPLVFVPYFLITRQWRQAAVATGTFAGASLIAFAILPQASIAYWTDKLWQTGRVGRTDSTVNKSLLGFLARLLGDGTTAKGVWLVLAVLVTALAFWQAWRSHRGGDALGAALMVGSLSVAVSPISWPHHQLWLVLVACWWVLQRGVWSKVLAAVLFAILMIYPAFDDYTQTAGLLAVLVELPALAVLLVLGAGARPFAAAAVDGADG